MWTRFVSIAVGLGFALLLAALGGACQGPVPGPPVPAAMQPAGGERNRVHEGVRVTGTDFVRLAHRDLGGSPSLTVDDRFQARLLPVEPATGAAIALEQVAFVDSQTLTVRVPPLESAGFYDLELTDPFGQTGRLVRAWEAWDPCASDEDCDDSDACTFDECDPDQSCQHADTSAECIDADPCTDDACDPLSGCTHSSNTAPCDDSDACTSDDACSGGVCSGTPILCDDANPCTDDSCDPVSGCVSSNNAAPCSDGNSCTIDDTCAGGACQPGANQCQCQADADCAEHEDGDLCNGRLVCQDNACVVDPASLVVCDPSADTACRRNRCDPATGLCGVADLPDGSNCSDADACTDPDVCSAGSCQPGPALQCQDDGNPCTDLPCVPAIGCTVVNNSEPCDDGDACTQADVCNAGLCSGTFAVCDDGNVCSDDGCDPAIGCTFTDNTAPCDDSNACTVNDTCAGGACQPGAALVCDDANQCTDDTCDPATGCSFTDNSAACEDGVFCNGSEVCLAGACISSLDPCQGQVCDEAGGQCLDFVELPDLFMDGTRFAFVFAYAGRIWLGPRGNGRGAVHVAPDGSDPVPVDFAFARDSIGNQHRNDSAPPYPSIGVSGCVADTSACGPDDENGRGIFGAGMIAGEEWLWVAGARSGGDLDYIYLTRDTDAVLDFAYLDMSVSLGGNTRGTSAAHAFGGRLYVGFPDDGGTRPYLMLVLRPPAYPGLNAVDNGSPCVPGIDDICDLEAKDMPAIGGAANPAMVDSITDFNDRLYLANNGGILRSTVSAPQDMQNFPGHWTVATPAAAEYLAAVSITTPKMADLEPADRAVPAMVVFGDRLFAARNTNSGPQLWACSPQIVSGPAPASAEGCDPGDWRLIAPDGTGLLTRFDNPNLTHLSLLVASANYLYLGFDSSAGGIVLFRTADPGATVEADFEGAGGCSASDHPGACEGFGGNGFGDPSIRRIFSALVASAGQKDYLYLVVGDGLGPARVFILGG